MLITFQCCFNVELNKIASDMPLTWKIEAWFSRMETVNEVEWDTTSNKSAKQSDIHLALFVF